MALVKSLSFLKDGEIFFCCLIMQAHGFEILCSKCESGVTSGSTSEDIPKSNIKWQQYVKALQASNYFRVSLRIQISGAYSGFCVQLRTGF